MRSKGWAPSDLAADAGVAVSTVTRWFAGKHQTARITKRMAIALGYPLSRYVKHVEVARGTDSAVAS